MNLNDALTWAAQRKHAVLITSAKTDAPSPATSCMHPPPTDSSSPSRQTAPKPSTCNATTASSLHHRPSLVVIRLTHGTAKLSPVATQPNDAICDALVDYYRSVTNTQHNDWPSYRQAMVDEKRLLVTIEPTTVAGQINPSS
jgi:hypothetical protein